MDIDKTIDLIKESKKCPTGYKYSKKTKSCVPKGKWHVLRGYYGRIRDENEDDDGKKNGKKNGSNGSGHSNGGSGNGNGGNGNGGNGNGGSNGGGGE